MEMDKEKNMESKEEKNKQSLDSLDIEDYAKIEQKWAEYWYNKGIFNSDPDPSKKKFFVTFPYPYMNGYLHIGHFYTLMRVEALARYKRLKGYNVLFPQAWHCTGSPIVSAAKRIAEHEPNQWKIMRDMGFSDEEIERFADPEEWARFFPEQAKKDFIRLGISTDFRREFITTELNPYYDKFIQWQFRKLRAKGYVIKGKHPVVWCPKCKTPVGDHARVEGEGERPQEFLLLKFKLLCDITNKVNFDDMLSLGLDLDNDKINIKEIVSKRTYLLAATLRPETVFGQTNLWIGDYDYVLSLVAVNDVKVDDNDKNYEIWITSKEAAEKLKLQDYDIKIIGKIRGRDLIGTFVIAPGINKEIPILPSTFCDPSKGTGIVTSVPSDAPDDYIGLKDLWNDKELCQKYNLDHEWIKKIEPIPIIDSGELGNLAAVKVVEEMGIKSQKERDKLEKAKKLVYKHGFYNGKMLSHIPKYGGMLVQEVKELVKKELISQHKALVFYELINPVICRCLTRCVVKIVSDQWFIKYSDKEWKQKTKIAFENIKLYPEDVRQQFLNVIDWLQDWPCTREFGLGTKLPWDKKWVIESLSDSTIYMAYYTVSHLIQKLSIDDVDDMLFDYIFLGDDTNQEVLKRRINKEKYGFDLDELRKQFDYFYPLDFRNSGKDLIQNHLTFFVFNHVAIFARKYWPRAIGVNGWIMIDGKKMSKSLGNFILLRDMIKRYGADASRFAVLNGGEGLDDANFDTEFVKSIKPKLIKFANFIFANYNYGVSSVDYEKFLKKIETTKLEFIDKIFLHHLNKTIRSVQYYMENLQFRSALQSLFFNLYPKTKEYIERVNHTKPNDKNVEETRRLIINYALESLVIMLSPFTPFICEEIWQSFGKQEIDKTNARGSVAFSKFPRYNEKFINQNYEHAEVLIENIIQDIKQILNLLEKKGIKKNDIKEIKLITPADWKYELVNEVNKLKNEEHKLDIKHVMKQIMNDPRFISHRTYLAKNLYKIINKPPIVLDNEQEIIAQNKSYIEHIIGCSVVIEKEEESREQKASASLPFKPSIVVKTRDAVKSKD